MRRPSSRPSPCQLRKTSAMGATTLDDDRLMGDPGGQEPARADYFLPAGFAAGAPFAAAAGAALAGPLAPGLPASAAAGAAPATAPASPGAPATTAASFFSLAFFLTFAPVRTFGRPKTESPSIVFLAFLSASSRSKRVHTLRERIKPSLTFRLRWMDMALSSGRTDRAEKGPYRARRARYVKARRAPRSAWRRGR